MDGGYHSEGEDAGSTSMGSSPRGSDAGSSFDAVEADAASSHSGSHFEFPDYDTPEVCELMEGDWLNTGLGLLTAA